MGVGGGVGGVCWGNIDTLFFSCWQSPLLVQRMGHRRQKAGREKNVCRLCVVAMSVTDRILQQSVVSPDLWIRQLVVVVVVVVAAASSWRARIFGRMFDNSFLACPLFSSFFKWRLACAT